MISAITILVTYCYTNILFRINLFDWILMNVIFRAYIKQCKYNPREPILWLYFQWLTPLQGVSRSSRPPQVDFVPVIWIWIQKVPAKTYENRGLKMFLTLPINVYSCVWCLYTGCFRITVKNCLLISQAREHPNDLKPVAKFHWCLNILKNIIETEQEFPAGSLQ